MFFIVSHLIVFTRGLLTKDNHESIAFFVKNCPCSGVKPERGFFASWGGEKARRGAKSPQKSGKARQGPRWGIFTSEDKDLQGEREMAFCGVASQNRSAEKINVQNRQISKLGFYKMFSRSFAAFQIYLYL